MRLVLAFALIAAATAASAEPNIRTPSPVIYLADNLDEADNHGWCIDTIGRGFGETLHTHSCKPQGGDVQFALNAETGQISSVAFDGKCMQVIAPDDPKVAFGLKDCDADLPTQRFVFDDVAGRISPADESDLCVAAGDRSFPAGPFMKRDLVLAACVDTAPELTTWVVKD